MNISKLDLLYASTTGDNTVIFEYSFDEDVFDELEAYTDPSSRSSNRKGCADNYARGYSDEKIVEPCPWHYYAFHERLTRYKSKLSYDRHGINHKLSVDMSSRQRTHSSVWKKEHANATDLDPIKVAQLNKTTIR
jgi:hypothetical protein